MSQTRLKLSKIILLLGIGFLGVIIGYFLPHNFGYQPYQVVNVIDGDTIQVKIGNKVETVRLLGINTPEVENPYRHQECFGPEASKETKELLTGKEVYLLPDPQAPNRGKYNRLLRYVFLPNGEFINAELVKQGYAFEYTYDSQPFQFIKYFNYLENQARKKKLGLWSEKCNYYFKFEK